MSNKYDRGLSQATPREQLLALGLSVVRVDGRIEVLSVTSSIDDLRKEFGKRHFTCDVEQFLLPLFRPLYEADPQIKEEVLRKFETQGLDVNLAHQYLTDMGDQPYLYMRLKHEGEIEPEVMDRLIDRAQQVMFDTLRTFLGFNQQSHE